jgi:hypothetical protein
MANELKRNLPIVLSAVVAIGLSGCAEKHQCQEIGQSAPKVTAPKVVQQPVQRVEDDKDRQIRALEIAIAEALSRQETTVKTIIQSTGGSLYPPDAEPGKCYARVLVPEKYEIKTEKILAKEQGQKLKVIPAKYNWVTKKVLVKEASEKIVSVPPTYTTVTEKVLVKPASERVSAVPATYKTVMEKVLVKEAHVTWKKGKGAIQKIDNGTGEIMCLVNVPAVYRTIKKKILVTPATTKVEPIPAVYKTVTRKVVATPATTKTIPIPAVYKTIRVKELVQPETTQSVTIPEVYKTVTRKVKVAEAYLKWQPVMCKTTMSSNSINIRNVQRALKDAGYNPGPIDGIVGRRTRNALHKFQNANGLSRGALTQETLEALGL